ncbi:hypothetical protein D1164_07665 [Mariniphaga sediminis]|uniref:Glycosyl hydrolase-like 10 domain-containing protein n=1 Tax=Mariniphaga sediminis TaxID=1628158 RepID=A0A399D483_9BACT|nr:family 10 glycosylhydrolase [Mariniphaga sediminis]RIH65541.1 hypothetical protein D1164_07665 [Mariniphaga sediminis]
MREQNRTNLRIVNRNFFIFNKMQIVFALLVLIIGILFSSCNQKSNNEETASLKFKVRALWVDPTGFVNAEAVDQMIAKCQRAGINTILPDIMLRENIYFKSSHFIGKVNADDQFDPLAYLIKKAHAVGIKVQAWSCTYYSKPQTTDWISRSFDRNDNSQIFLSPGHPEVNPYMLSVLKDLLAYDIDGIHLDYIRYCNAAFDYSDVSRSTFQATSGFDPLNFLDHPELIVPTKQDKFPIRVLHPKTQIDRVWEIGVVERNLNCTEVGFAFVSESPENIDALHIPGLLIISHFTNVSASMAAAIKRYADRGGNIIWIDPLNRVLSEYPDLQLLTGLTGTKPLPAGRVVVEKNGDHPAINSLQPFSINTSGGLPVVSNADVIAKLSTGEPIITINNSGNSKVMVIGFRAMESTSRFVIDLLKDIMIWYRSDAGVQGEDLLARKRIEWSNWRADQVLELVCEVNKMLKEKDKNLVVTSSAGVGPKQSYGVYRNGATWLKEGINDYLFPMNYTTSTVEFEEILKEQIHYTPDGMSNRIYPGLQIYNVENNVLKSLPAEIVEKQLQLVHRYGYQGFCLFAYNSFSDEIVEMLSTLSY